MAVDCNLGAVVGEEEGAIGSIPGNEGRIAQAMSERLWRSVCFLGVFLALRRLDREE